MFVCVCVCLRGPVCVWWDVEIWVCLFRVFFSQCSGLIGPPVRDRKRLQLAIRLGEERTRFICDHEKSGKAEFYFPRLDKIKLSMEKCI